MVSLALTRQPPDKGLPMMAGLYLVNVATLKQNTLIPARLACTDTRIPPIIWTYLQFFRASN
ncbi:hypothetical protein CUC53_16120 [Aeromonas cavernicola]|uniref:Uncharacterized protein n=1 Tax=Aeromonas cavernicola TaxID=1006623 RepID=A0A2H9U184_9GAMM|nr:hypothetical protein CUC53_16120 [Aeromonas cavernicola]